MQIVDKDLLALTKMMKASLDKSLENCVDNIVICRIQVIGKCINIANIVVYNQHNNIFDVY